MPQYLDQYLWQIIILAVWSLIWKGQALWKAARLGQRNWFIILLIVNTLGILEIIYLKFISPNSDQGQTKINN